MIKDKLRKDLISYISVLFGYRPQLEDMSYTELFSEYIDLLGVSPSEVSKEILREVQRYHEQFPDSYIDEEQIINDAGLLQPISMCYFINRQIADMKLEIIEMEAEIIWQQKQLEEDEKALKDPNLNWSLRAELPSDISYEKFVINTYPINIQKLQEKIKIKEDLLLRISKAYNLSDDEQLFRK